MKPKRYLSQWNFSEDRWGVYDTYQSNWHSHHRTEYMAKRTAAFEEADFIKSVHWYRKQLRTVK